MPTIMNRWKSAFVSLLSRLFDFIKQQVDTNEGFDEDTRPVRVHDSAYLKQLLES